MGGEGGAGGVNAHLTACGAILARLALFLIDIYRHSTLRGFLGHLVRSLVFVQIFFNFFSNFIDEWRTVCYSILAGGR